MEIQVHRVPRQVHVHSVIEPDRHRLALALHVNLFASDGNIQLFALFQMVSRISSTDFGV